MADGIIGDVHGHADHLEALLEKLRHPDIALSVVPSPVQR